MTPMSVQDKLKNELDELFAEFEITGRKQVTIYKQDITLEERESVTSKAPYVIILLRSGKMVTEDSIQSLEVDFRFECMVADDDKSLSGYQDIMLIIQKLLYHFIEYRSIPDSYEVKEDITFDLIESTSYGIYLGIIDMTLTHPIVIQRKEEFDDI